MRLPFAIVKLALLVALISFLALQPGTARIVWHGYIVETSAAVLVGVTLIGACVLFVLFRIWRLIKDGPRVWRLSRRVRAMRRGQDYLTRGFAALAAGEAGEAGRMATLARRALGEKTATLLVRAQAAQMAGDREAARSLYRTMAADGESAVLGYRGLITLALNEGDRDEAARMAAKLYRVRPETPWLALVRADLATRAGHWDEASAALAEAVAGRQIPAADGKRRQAALQLGLALEALDKGAATAALASAEKAARLAPGWTPAHLVLARCLLAGDHMRAARRVIERGVRLEPHPEWHAMIRQAWPEDNDIAYYKRLLRVTDDEGVGDTGALVALGEAAMSAGLWGEARRHLSRAAQGADAPQKAFRLLGDLEKRESGDTMAAHRWMERAASAAPDPRWLCCACDASAPAWKPVCPHCGAFDRLAWGVPGMGHDAPQANATLFLS